VILKMLALVLVVGVAAPVVQVPNVVGLSYERAKARLYARGLQVGNVVPGHCDRPVGAVCRQNPQAGRKVDITEPVHLIVSRGPKRSLPAAQIPPRKPRGWVSWVSVADE